MEESILTSIKKMSGIDEEYTHFDPDLIMHINTVLIILIQMGIGPENGFRINDKTETWKDFLGEDIGLELIKSLVHIRVKLLFDPPLSASVIKVYEDAITELEWRAYTIVENRRIITEKEV